jgi:hypothetical protein
MITLGMPMPVDAQSVSLEVDREWTITELMMYMNVFLGLNQFTLKFSPYVIYAFIAFILNDHVVHSHTK